MINKKGEIIELMEKPNLISIMVGGVIMSVLIYFGLNSLKWEYTLYLQIVLILSVLALSYGAGNSVDVIIRLNTSTGWIYANKRTQYWEGYCDDLSQFIVVQKDEEDHTRTVHTLYKLYLGLSDDSFYEVRLHPTEVKAVIEAVDMTKSARS